MADSGDSFKEKNVQPIELPYHVRFENDDQVRVSKSPTSSAATSLSDLLQPYSQWKDEQNQMEQRIDDLAKEMALVRTRFSTPDSNQRTEKGSMSDSPVLEFIDLGSTPNDSSTNPPVEASDQRLQQSSSRFVTGEDLDEGAATRASS